jgi:saccharopine dehydrogenase-like NADP-dependent oxidoreductase
MKTLSECRNMKVIVLGCGNIGSVATEDLANSMSSTEVVVADKNEGRAKDVVKRIGMSNVTWIQSDVASHEELVDTLKGFDLTMGFLPGNLGYRLAEACIEAHKDLVDVSYMPENPMHLNEAAVRAGSTIVPDCGLAPGISNVLVGHCAAALDEVEAVHIMVGGLPEKPVPPLGYVITWSPESLIDEYTRKAAIVRRGQAVEVEALSGVEEVEFPNVGKLEAFYTDGLRTLLYTLKHVDDMWEKTLRYPGHAEKVKLLETLGFFSEANVNIEGADIQPRKLTAKIFEQKLSNRRQKDIVVLKVETRGVKNNKEMTYVYDLLDFYDKRRGVTAMARTTAYPASIVAQLILKKALKEKGVVPPERIGMDNRLFRIFSENLESHGININEEKKSPKLARAEMANA